MIYGTLDGTLQFEQQNYRAGVSRFFITLAGLSELAPEMLARSLGSGTVALAVDGITSGKTPVVMTEFIDTGSIRVLSGVGAANAAEGQGNDALDLSALSFDAGGVSFDLTNRGSPLEPPGSPKAVLSGQSAGDVRYSKNDHSSPSRPAEADFESLFMNIAGVEHVTAGTGNDLLFIDETEADKNNTFYAGDGIDRVEYQNFFGSAELDAEPTVTVRVNSLGVRAHELLLSGGRNGSVVATDELIDVEIITLLNSSNTGKSPRSDDTIDISALSGRVVVDYRTGEIHDAHGNVHLTIENIQEFERVVSGEYGIDGAGSNGLLQPEVLELIAGAASVTAETLI